MRSANLSLLVCLLAVTSAAQNVDEQMHAAKAAFDARRYAEAEQIYSAALDRWAKDGRKGITGARLLFGLGTVLHMEGRCDAASRALRRAVAQYEANSEASPAEAGDAWLLLGATYYAQRLYTKAEQAYGRGLDLVRNIPGRSAALVEGLSGLAAVYEKQHRDGEAAATLDAAARVARLTPGVPASSVALLLNNLGNMQRLQGRRGEAEKTLREALRTLDESPAPHDLASIFVLNNLALTCFELKRYSEAAALFASAVSAIDRGAEVLPRDALTIMQNYARSLRKAGNKGLATLVESRAGAIRSALPRLDAGSLLVDVHELSREK